MNNRKQAWFLMMTLIVTLVGLSNGCKPSNAESPVCGTDGKTYQNSGYLFCATMATYHDPSRFLIELHFNH